MKIYINVYDISPLNYYLHGIGLGAYHTGVQIGQTEYCFGFHEGNYSGVCEQTPKQSTNENVFREQIYMGETKLTYNQIKSVLDELKSQFIGRSYDLFSKNCNHFSNEVCIRLLNKPLPGFVNRLSYIANSVRCCIPMQMMNQTRDQQNYNNQMKGGKGNNGNEGGNSIKNIIGEKYQALKQKFSGNGIQIGQSGSSSSQTNNQQQQKYNEKNKFLKNLHGDIENEQPKTDDSLQNAQ